MNLAGCQRWREGARRRKRGGGGDDYLVCIEQLSGLYYLSVLSVLLQHWMLQKHLRTSLGGGSLVLSDDSILAELRKCCCALPCFVFNTCDTALFECKARWHVMWVKVLDCNLKRPIWKFPLVLIISLIMGAWITFQSLIFPICRWG